MLFIFDENYSKQLCDGIQILEQGNHRSPVKADVVHAVEFMKRSGASDTELIAAASKREAIIFTHDKDFRRIKHYKELMIQHEVGYVYFKTPREGGYHYWDMVTSFVNRWEELKKKIKSDALPYAYEVDKKGHLNRYDSF